MTIECVTHARQLPLGSFGVICDTDETWDIFRGRVCFWVPTAQAKLLYPAYYEEHKDAISGAPYQLAVLRDNEIDFIANIDDSKDYSGFQVRWWSNE